MSHSCKSHSAYPFERFFLSKYFIKQTDFSRTHMTHLWHEGNYTFINFLKISVKEVDKKWKISSYFLITVPE